MREKRSRHGTVLLACVALSVPAARAAGWNGSYAADGHCHCSGTLDPTLAAKIVPTPVGGQSIAAVCERVGAGPGLRAANGRSGRALYADPQCGNGPFPAGSPTPVCSDDVAVPGCWLPGPRWNLGAAYPHRAREAIVEAVGQLDRPGAIGALAAPPVLAAAVARPAPRDVVVDGRRWRPAPPGTAEKGTPGSRIVLDGRLYLESGEAADALPADASAEPLTVPDPTAASSAPVEPGAAPRSGSARLSAARIGRHVDAAVSALRARHRVQMAGARALVRARQGWRGEPAGEKR